MWDALHILRSPSNAAFLFSPARIGHKLYEPFYSPLSIFIFIIIFRRANFDLALARCAPDALRERYECEITQPKKVSLKNVWNFPGKRALLPRPVWCFRRVARGRFKLHYTFLIADFGLWQKLFQTLVAHNQITYKNGKTVFRQLEFWTVLQHRNEKKIQSERIALQPLLTAKWRGPIIL